MATNQEKKKIQEADANLQLYSSDEYRAQAQKWVELRIMVIKVAKIVAYLVPIVSAIASGVEVFWG